MRHLQLNIDWVTLLVVILILVATLLVLFVFLIINKLFAIKYLNHKAKLKEMLGEHLYEFITEGKEIKTRILKDKQVYLDAFEELFDEYRDVVKSDEMTDRIRSFSESIFVETYRQRLNHRRWSIRMNTLFRIEDFHLHSLEEDVLKFYKREDITELELYQALRILASLQSKQFYEEMIQFERVLPNFLYKDILDRFEEPFLVDLIDNFEHYPMSLKEAIIDIIGLRKDYRYIPFLESILSSSDVELRIRSLKSLRLIGHVTNINLVLSLKDSEQWQERMMVAKLLGILKKEEYTPVLESFLHDRDWWVRHAAGESIVQQINGIKVLKNIVTLSKDRFAREMAMQWIEWRELHG